MKQLATAEGLTALGAAEDRVVRDALPGLTSGLAVLQSVLAVVHALGSPIERPLVLVDAVSVVVAVAFRAFLGHRTLPERWANPFAVGYALVAIAIILIHLAVLADPIQTLMLVLVLIGAGSVLLSFGALLSLAAIAWLGWFAVMAALGFPLGSRRFGIALLSSAAVAAMILAARRSTFRRLDEARRSLRESEETHRLLFDRGPLPTWVFDAESLRFLAVNEAALSHYGYSRDEFLDRTVEALRAEGARPLPLDHAKNDAGVPTLERHQTRGGTLIDVEVVSHRIAFGEWKAVLAVLTDVTERIRSEETLRRSRESFQQLFEEAPMGMAIIGSDSRFARANRALCDILGYTREELTEMTLSGLVAPADLDRHVAIGQEFLEGRRSSFKVEARYRRKSGELFWGSLTVERIEDSTGQMLFVLALFDDISESRHRTEERERMIVELQEALASVKTLRGLIPICASCKKVRDDQGYWSQVEVYVRDRSEAEFSHGICPDCRKKLYGR
ncbi:MAG TPA: PAS domain S-box protein [Vicinamibacteria bacterium]|nr:PAS domain S-box protein [Vicinamibacteria bacterium]